MEILLAVFYIAVFAFAIHKGFGKNDDNSSDRKNIDFAETKKHIDNLNILKDRLEQVENMITDIECCSPEKHQTFITVASGTREVELHIDGENQTTQNLLKTLYAERKKLRTSLSDEIRNMGVRCNGNCNEIYAKNERGGVR